MVSGKYFPALGVAMVLGRTIVPADSQPSADAVVAVISHRLCESRFGRDRGTIGRKLMLTRTVFTIVGVAPPAFFGTSVGDMAGEARKSRLEFLNVFSA
jgi:hypothetical protein